MVMVGMLSVLIAVIAGKLAAFISAVISKLCSTKKWYNFLSQSNYDSDNGPLGNVV